MPQAYLARLGAQAKVEKERSTEAAISLRRLHQGGVYRDRLLFACILSQQLLIDPIFVSDLAISIAPPSAQCPPPSPFSHYLFESAVLLTFLVTIYHVYFA